MDVRRLASCLPPIVWMGVILWLSGDSWNSDETGRLFEPMFRWLLPAVTPAQQAAFHRLIRKVAHLTEYAVLAALWLRALVRDGQPARRAAWIALTVSGLWALVDEGRQAAQPNRTGSALDVAVDTTGAVIALTLLTGDWRRLVDGTATALLWFTAIGGVAAIVVNLVAGVTAVALWITTAGAAALLVWRWRARAVRRARLS